MVGLDAPAPRHASARSALLSRHHGGPRMSFGPLVSAEWLREHLRDPDVRVIDFRWYLAADRKGREEYQRGQIPGAGFVGLEAVTGTQSKNNRGRHPMPANWQ